MEDKLKNNQEENNLDTNQPSQGQKIKQENTDNASENMEAKSKQQENKEKNQSGRDSVQSMEEELEKLQNEHLEKLSELEKKLEESNEKFLRLFSEFDNFRKRTSKERIELSKTASADIIVALLPVLDDLERAAQAEKEQDQDNNGGISLIYNKFRKILEQKGVEEIPTVGEEFNTDFHEAISHVPAKDKKQKGKVIEEVQRGYLLNEKVIRFARVVVAN